MVFISGDWNGLSGRLEGRGGLRRDAGQIAGFEDLPYADNEGEPIVGAAVPGIDRTRTGTGGWSRCWRRRSTTAWQAQPTIGWNSVPLLVGLAEPDGPAAGPSGRTIVANVQQRLDVRFHPKHSSAFAAGHTAGFEALRGGPRIA